MEPDSESLLSAVQALAVLSIIPVAIFALWVDYFNKQIHDLLIKRPTFDREGEVEKVRFGSLLVILFQFILYIGSHELRKAYPLICELILLASAGIQLFIQVRVEKSIKPNPQPGTASIFTIFAKATRAWIIISFSCLIPALLLIQVFSFLATYLHTSQTIGTLLLTLGGVIGLTSGLILNFALGPYHIHKIFPTAPLKNHPSYSRIVELFTQNNLKVPNLWIIEFDKLRVIDTSLLGFKNGKSLFISRATLNQLTDSELDSLIKIQISHVLLKHFKNRSLLLASLMINSILLATLTALTLQYFRPGQDTYEFFGSTIGITSLLISFRWIAMQKENHEFQADIYAIDRLQVRFEDLSLALRKLDFAIIRTFYKKNKQDLPMMGYPETEKRIYLLQSYLHQQGQAKEAKRSSKDDQESAPTSLAS